MNNIDITKIKGHPSVGKVLTDLISTGKVHDKKTAARLYALIERLNLDPYGKTTYWINVCEFEEFSRKRNQMIFHKVLRAKLFPSSKKIKVTDYRLFFIIDDDLECNIYLYLSKKPYDGVKEIVPGWKSVFKIRYMDFQYQQKTIYSRGETPVWRSS